jgi:hypothetical protein
MNEFEIMEKANKISAQVTLLSAHRQFREAIDYGKAELLKHPEFSDEDKTIVYTPMMKAAAEAGFRHEAVEYAKKVAITDPDMPSVKKVFKLYL